jgi:hypothetical protein
MILEMQAELSPLLLWNVTILKLERGRVLHRLVAPCRSVLQCAAQRRVVGDSEGWERYDPPVNTWIPYVSWQAIATLFRRMFPVVEILFSLFVLKSMSVDERRLSPQHLAAGNII